MNEARSKRLILGAGIPALLALILLAIALIVGLFGSDDDKPPARGEIGGPPTVNEFRGDDQNKVIPPALVVLHENSPDGPVELVAYSEAGPSGPTFCLELDLPARGEFGTSCRTRDSRNPVVLSGLSNTSATWLAGRVPLDTADVAVSDSGSDPQSLTKLLSKPDEDVFAALHQPEPSGFFAIRIPGCRNRGKVTLIARDEHGESLGSTTAASSPCHFGTGTEEPRKP